MILYNSLGQTKQEFVPHTPGKVNKIGRAHV